jgi:multiple sugar transport system permease protein
VTIYALNTFDLIFALTGGGPGRATEVLALFMYQEAFGTYALGRGAAIAVVMLGINLTVTAVYLRTFDVWEEL